MKFDYLTVNGKTGTELVSKMMHIPWINSLYVSMYTFIKQNWNVANSVKLSEYAYTEKYTRFFMRGKCWISRNFKVELTKFPMTKILEIRNTNQKIIRNEECKAGQSNSKARI